MLKRTDVCVTSVLLDTVQNHSNSAIPKFQYRAPLNEKAGWQENPSPKLSPKTIKDIRRVFQKGAQDDLEAERHFMLRQRRLKQEEQQSRGRSL
ncbi:unnamed protein product [Fructobacillus tropaeoli]|nr:unnamed protein product [Fructobacillus tropaeoli]